jgi:hypothetical protein
MESESRYFPYGSLRWTNGTSVTDFGFSGQRNEGLPNDDDNEIEYVADPNMFLDRVEGGFAQPLRIDSDILANSDITLYVPATAVSEVYPIP